MKNVLYVLLGVVAGFIMAGVLIFVSRAPAGEPIVLQPAPTKELLRVQVEGGVARPGVYKLPDGSRKQDAIDAAGGLLTSADTSTLNLAEKIKDEERIAIPCSDGSCTVADNTNTLDLPNATETPTDNTNSDLIDINTASAEELATLPGIGPTLAQNIVDYREANGPFAVIEDIMNVDGIGQSKFDTIKDLIVAQ